MCYSGRRVLRAEYEPRRNKDVARDGQTGELAVPDAFRSPRTRNKPTIIRLGELQLRLARRGLVASCAHRNPLPDDGGKLTPAVKTFSAPRNRTVIRGCEFRNRESRPRDAKAFRTRRIEAPTGRYDTYYIRQFMIIITCVW